MALMARHDYFTLSRRLQGGDGMRVALRADFFAALGPCADMGDAFDKSQVVVCEVEVRPARPDKRRRWDALMAQYHFPAFTHPPGSPIRNKP